MAPLLHRAAIKNRDAQKKRTSHKVVESVLRPEGSLWWERFVKKIGTCLESRFMLIDQNALSLYTQTDKTDTSITSLQVQLGSQLTIIIANGFHC